MATEATKVAELIETLHACEGESAEVLFDLLPKRLTPERKAHLQAPKGSHRPNRVSWQDAALDELFEAIELEALE